MLYEVITFLLHRKLAAKNESRMWFNPAALETLALHKIKKYNTNKLEMEMATYCRDVMEVLQKDKIRCCPKDLLEVLRECVITSYSIHYTKLYDVQPQHG